ncbi:MAG: hypothetical protein V3U60_16310 [Gammaproteobacteria bacterium]
MIELQIDGQLYSGFVNATVARSVTTLAGTFSIGMTAQQGRVFPVTLGSAVVIFVDETQVINGFVETIDVDYDSESHSIVVGGRDRTADFIDSSVGAVSGLQPGITLTELIRRTLDSMGLDEIQVVTEVGSEPFDEFELAPEIDQTGDEFIEPFTRARTVLATTDGKGNIVLTRAGEQSAPGAIKQKVGAKDNTVLSASLALDTTERFSRYTVKSQDVFSRETEGLDLDTAIDVVGAAADSEIRTSRNLTIEAEENLITISDVESRAEWEANIARAKGTQAEFVVRGYSVNGKLWEPNQKVAVDDDFLDIRSTMLIESVVYELSLSGGSTTRITCVPPDSYLVAAERDAVSARIDVMGGDFF